MENSHTLLEDAELAHFDLVLGCKMASHMVVSSSHLMYFGSSILQGGRMNKHPSYGNP